MTVCKTCRLSSFAEIPGQLQSGAPCSEGTAQNPDIYFNSEAANSTWLPDVVAYYMQEISKLTGRVTVF